MAFGRKSEENPFDHYVKVENKTKLLWKIIKKYINLHT